jgi:hypothetical protein
MLREAAERERLLRDRIAQWEARFDEQRRQHQVQVWRLDDIIDAQRLMIEKMLAEKRRGNS